MIELVRRVRERLGPEVVANGPAVALASADVEDAGHRFVAVLRPRSVEEVQAVLALASATGQPVRPWSRGLNWGYGTRTPVDRRCVGLDLSALDAIRRFDPEAGVVEIEPGVTQGCLADWLRERDAGWYLDVTGSARGSSVLGNALDRGIAYSSLRAEALRHVEVVLASGRLLHTGTTPWSTEVSDRYPLGLGPDLTGLFVQSNLGVVTAVTLALRPVPERRLTLRAGLRDPGQLPAFLRAIGDLKRDLGLDTIVHVADGARAMATLAPLARQHATSVGLELDRAGAEQLIRSVIGPGWAALGVIEGDRRRVRSAAREARRRLRPFGPVAFLDRRRLERLAGLAGWLGARRRVAVARAALEMSGLTAGVPTDGPLHGLYWDHVDEEPAWRTPEASQVGWLLVSPLIPLRPGAVTRALDTLHTEADRAGVRVAVTLNVIGPSLVLAIASLTWLREDRQAGARALEAQERLVDRFFAEGTPPYRLATAEQLRVPWDPVQAEVIRSLKRALDPAGILDPGRYAPAREVPCAS